MPTCCLEPSLAVRRAPVAGLLPAIAIGASRNESELLEDAAKALRIALCVGACGELGDDTDGSGTHDSFAPAQVCRAGRRARGGEVGDMRICRDGSAVHQNRWSRVDAFRAEEVSEKAPLSPSCIYAARWEIGIYANSSTRFAMQLQRCACQTHQLSRWVWSNRTGQLVGKGTSFTERALEAALASCYEWCAAITYPAAFSTSLDSLVASRARILGTQVGSSCSGRGLLAATAVPERQRGVYP
ncbi:hypothetical protein BDW66DRAFT_147502 [Aspergillus desertorum]